MNTVARNRSLVRSSTARSCFRTAVFFFLSAAVSLVTYSQDLERLSEQVNQGSVEQKRNALGEIRNLRSETASRIAVPALRDSDELVRATAINAVIFMPEPEVADVLVPFLNDKAEFIRRETAYALGEARAATAVPDLGRSTLRDRASIVRAAAAAALGKIGSEAALTTLTAVLNRKPTSDDELLRRASARSIGQIAEMRRFGRISAATPVSFLPDKYKIQVVDASTREASTAFAVALRTLLKVAADRKETDDTRREAAFALGAIGDASALPFLRANTSNSDSYLAEICREALLKISK